MIYFFISGCSTSDDSATDWEKFAIMWKEAAIQEKKQMTDISDIANNFKDTDREYVISIFGKPSFQGRNNFGQYELRYDFNSVPETDEKMMQYLSFIIEKEAVIRVEALLLPEE